MIWLCCVLSTAVLALQVQAKMELWLVKQMHFSNLLSNLYIIVRICQHFEQAKINATWSLGIALVEVCIAAHHYKAFITF